MRSGFLVRDPGFAFGVHPETKRLLIRFFELGITTELGLFLVEFGFPTDTIRALENKYPAIGRMGAVEAATFLGRNPRMLYNVMDSYEQELYKKAIQVLLKRK